MKKVNAIKITLVLLALALALDAWLCNRAAQGLCRWKWLEWSTASERHPALFVLSAMLIALLVMKKVVGKAKAFFTVARFLILNHRNQI